MFFWLQYLPMRLQIGFENSLFLEVKFEFTIYLQLPNRLMVMSKV